MRFATSKYSTEELVGMAMAIRERYPTPIIAICGSTVPKPPYERTAGYQCGELLARDLPKGTLLTGGVDGVGIDFYVGYLRRQLIERTLLDPEPIAPFFTLVPEREQVGFFKKGKPYYAAYQLPEAYEALSQLAGVDLTVERIGDSLSDRRKCLSIVSDILVVLNGSDGTMDEAVGALQLQKPVIVVRTTGGVAAELAKIKEMGGVMQYDPLMEKPWIPGDLNIAKIHIVNNVSEVMSAIQQL